MVCDKRRKGKDGKAAVGNNMVNQKEIIKKMETRSFNRYCILIFTTASFTRDKSRNMLVNKQISERCYIHTTKRHSALERQDMPARSITGILNVMVK